MLTVYLTVLLANASITLSLLFIPILTKEFGISYFDLGLIGTAYGLMSFFSFSLFGRLSDLAGRRKIFVQIGLAVSSLAFLLQLLMRDVESMLLIRALAGFSIGIFSFPLLAYVSGLRGYREKVGWYVGFGSLGWFVGYLAAGLLSSPPLAFVLAGCFLAVGFLLSSPLREVGRVKIKISPFLDIVKRNSVLYLSYFLRHTGAQAIWIIFPLYLLELGASIFWVGVILGVNTLTQFFVMGFLGRRASRREDKRLIQLGLVFSSIVFLYYYFATSHFQILPAQLLLGVSWGSLYTGSLFYLLERNVEKATSTGVLGSTISLAWIVGPLLGGLVSQAFGMRSVMLMACGLTLSGLVASRHIKKPWGG
jgi:MFS family permease